MIPTASLCLNEVMLWNLKRNFCELKLNYRFKPVQYPIGLTEGTIDAKCLLLVKRKGKISHQHIMTFRVSLMTRQKFLPFDTEVFIRLPYSDKIAFLN